MYSFVKVQRCCAKPRKACKVQRQRFQCSQSWTSVLDPAFWQFFSFRTLIGSYFGEFQCVAIRMDLIARVFDVSFWSACGFTWQLLWLQVEKLSKLTGFFLKVFFCWAFGPTPGPPNLLLPNVAETGWQESKNDNPTCKTIFSLLFWHVV